MNRAALKRDGAIGRRRTQNQVDGEISVNRLNRKPFIGFAQNANISVYVGIHEKWLEIGGLVQIREACMRTARSIDAGQRRVKTSELSA